MPRCVLCKKGVDKYAFGMSPHNTFVASELCWDCFRAYIKSWREKM